MLLGWSYHREGVEREGNVALMENKENTLKKF